jgi:hypothetical protein
MDPVARRFPYLYAYVITGFTFLFILIVIFGPALLPKGLPDPSWRVIDTVLGFLLGVGLSAIIQYFYGSSHDSKARDEQIRSLAAMAKDEQIGSPATMERFGSGSGATPVTPPAGEGGRS